jgi:hypothetical protein
MSQKAQAAPKDTQQPPAQTAQPATSTFTVMGWLASILALVPLLMAAHGDGRVYLWSGLVMILVGGILLVIGHVRQNFD